MNDIIRTLGEMIAILADKINLFSSLVIFSTVCLLIMLAMILILLFRIGKALENLHNHE